MLRHGQEASVAAGLATNARAANFSVRMAARQIALRILISCGREVPAAQAARAPVDARKPSAKAPAYRPKGSATLIPNLHPAACPPGPRCNHTHSSISSHARQHRATVQRTAALAYPRKSPHPHVSAHLPALPCYSVVEHRLFVGETCKRLPTPQRILSPGLVALSQSRQNYRLHRFQRHGRAVAQGERC